MFAFRFRFRFHIVDRFENTYGYVLLLMTLRRKDVLYTHGRSRWIYLPTLAFPLLPPLIS